MRSGEPAPIRLGTERTADGGLRPVRQVISVAAPTNCAL